MQVRLVSRNANHRVLTLTSTVSVSEGCDTPTDERLEIDMLALSRILGSLSSRRETLTPGRPRALSFGSAEINGMVLRTLKERRLWCLIGRWRQTRYELLRVIDRSTMTSRLKVPRCKISQYFSGFLPLRVPHTSCEFAGGHVAGCFLMA